MFYGCLRLAVCSLPVKDLSLDVYVHNNSFIRENQVIYSRKMVLIKVIIPLYEKINISTRKIVFNKVYNQRNVGRHIDVYHGKEMGQFFHSDCANCYVILQRWRCL